MKSVFRKVGSYPVMAILATATLSLLLCSPLSAETGTGRYGTWVRGALDDQGNIHMVYGNSWEPVYYSKCTNGSWSSPVQLPNSSPCWFNFTNPDIDVGPDGKPQVVYGIFTGDYPNDLEYVFYAKANDVNGTSWSVTTIGGDGYRRNHARIAVDENNVAHITYMKTNKYQPWWWQIIYRRPDGSEKIIQGTSPESYRCNNPDIAYKDGIVHIAWYEGGSGTMTTNIMHSAGAPYSDFPIFERLTNMSYRWFVGDPGIAISPDGQVDIVYIVADYNSEPGLYKGVYSTRTGLVDGGWAAVDEEQEDWGPSITYMDNGTRFVAWSHHHNGETMYVRNSEPKQTLTPWGNIDVFAGAGGAYYLRVHGAPGQVFSQQLEGGPPPNQAPVAQFTVTPMTGDIFTVFAFDAAASYDPDNNLPLTYWWDWDDDGDFDLVQVGLATATHSFPYPATYRVNLRVEDSLGAQGGASRDVEVANLPPEASFTAALVAPDSALFDASLSSDPEDTTQLQYRWDWESDGTFDTRWSGLPQILHAFPGPGAYAVTLEVMDMLGSADDTTITVEFLAPEPPTNVAVSCQPIDAGWAVMLSWTPSASGDVIEQLVQRSDNGSPWEDQVALGPEVSAFEDTLALPGIYGYRISVTNGFYHAYSESVTVEAVGTDRQLGVPSTLAMSSVLPNPTSGAVILRMGFPGSGRATLALHDMAGRVVARRTIPVAEACWMESRWDLTKDNVRPGAYMVRLSMDALSASLPLVVVW